MLDPHHGRISCRIALVGYSADGRGSLAVAAQLEVPIRGVATVASGRGGPISSGPSSLAPEGTSPLKPDLLVPPLDVPSSWRGPEGSCSRSPAPRRPAFRTAVTARH